jgi:PAS domain S-box-containing protein
VSGNDEGWERLFWTLFERSTNPIAVLDDQLRFIALNEPALETLGNTRGFLIGRSSLDIVAESERPKAAEEWRVLLGTGEASGDRTVVRFDGTPMLIEFAARLAMVEGRRLAVYVVTELREPTPAGRPSEPDAEALTPREREVVTLIALGEDTAGVAAELTISPETARTHVRNAMRKLGVRTRAQLVAVSLAAGVIAPLPQME